MVGLPTPLRGTVTLILPGEPVVIVPVALMDVVSWLVLGSNCP